MTFDVWPIVGRARLVRAFRPGEPPSREAPFRTLRRHRWSTVGVTVISRADRHASGRSTIFSVLNVEAARCGREGHGAAAMALARAAAKVEGSDAFAALQRLLSGRSSTEVRAAIEGDVAEASWPELHEALRGVARENRRARVGQKLSQERSATFVGKVARVETSYLVLESASGAQTYVPRALAHSIRREKVGDLLAVVIEKLDHTQMVVSAVPAIRTSRSSPAPFTPFGRSAPVRTLSAKDARLFARAPAPLEIRIPVTIEQ